MSSGKFKKKLGSSRQSRQNRDTKEKGKDEGSTLPTNNPNIVKSECEKEPSDSLISIQFNQMEQSNNPHSTATEVASSSQLKDELVPQDEVSIKRKKMGSSRKGNRGVKGKPDYDDTEPKVIEEESIGEEEKKNDYSEVDPSDCPRSQHQSSVVPQKHLEHLDFSPSEEDQHHEVALSEEERSNIGVTEKNEYQVSTQSLLESPERGNPLPEVLMENDTKQVIKTELTREPLIDVSNERLYVQMSVEQSDSMNSMLNITQKQPRLDFYESTECRRQDNVDSVPSTTLIHEQNQDCLFGIVIEDETERPKKDMAPLETEQNVSTGARPNVIKLEENSMDENLKLNEPFTCNSEFKMEKETNSEAEKWLQDPSEPHETSEPESGNLLQYQSEQHDYSEFRRINTVSSVVEDLAKEEENDVNTEKHCKETNTVGNDAQHDIIEGTSNQQLVSKICTFPSESGQIQETEINTQTSNLQHNNVGKFPAELKRHPKNRTDQNTGMYNEMPFQFEQETEEEPEHIHKNELAACIEKSKQCESYGNRNNKNTVMLQGFKAPTGDDKENMEDTQPQDKMPQTSVHQEGRCIEDTAITKVPSENFICAQSDISFVPQTFEQLVTNTDCHTTTIQYPCDMLNENVIQDKDEKKNTVNLQNDNETSSALFVFDKNDTTDTLITAQERKVLDKNDEDAKFTESTCGGTDATVTIQSNVAEHLESEVFDGQCKIEALEGVINNKTHSCHADRDCGNICSENMFQNASSNSNHSMEIIATKDDDIVDVAINAESLMTSVEIVEEPKVKHSKSNTSQAPTPRHDKTILADNSNILQNERKEMNDDIGCAWERKSDLSITVPQSEANADPGDDKDSINTRKNTTFNQLAQNPNKSPEGSFLSEFEITPESQNQSIEVDVKDKKKNENTEKQVKKENNLIRNDNFETKTLKINTEPSDQFIESQYEPSELINTIQSEDVDQGDTSTDPVLCDTVSGIEIAKTTEKSESECPNNPPEGTLLSETGFEILESCSYQSNISEISGFTSVQYEDSPQVPLSQTSYSGNSEPGEDTEKDKHDIENQPHSSDLLFKPEESKESHDAQNKMTGLREKTEESEQYVSSFKVSDIHEHHTVSSDEACNIEECNDVTEQHRKSEVNYENETDLTYLTEQKKLTFILKEALTDCAVQERNIENRSSNQEHANSPSPSLEPRPETDITSVMPLYSENTDVLTQDQNETLVNRELDPKQFISPHPDVVQALQPTHVTEEQVCEPGKKRKMGSTRKTHGRQIAHVDNIDKQDKEVNNLITNETGSEDGIPKTDFRSTDQTKLLNAMQCKSDEDERVTEDTVVNTDSLEIAKTTEELEAECLNNPPEGTLLSETGFEILESCNHQSNISEISGFTSVQYEDSPQVPLSQTSYSGNSEPGEDTEKDKHDIENQPHSSDLLFKPEASKESHDAQNKMTGLRKKTEESEQSVSSFKVSDIHEHHTVSSDEACNIKECNDVTEQHKKSEVNYENETDLTYLTEQKKLTFTLKEALTDCAVQERNIENRSSNQEHANSPSPSLEPRPETDITSVMPLYSENTEVLTQDQNETLVNRELDPKQFTSPHPDVVQALQPTHVTEEQVCEPGKRRKMGSTRKTHGRQNAHGDNKETTLNLNDNIDQQDKEVNNLITNETGSEDGIPKTNFRSTNQTKLLNAMQCKPDEDERVTEETVINTDSVLCDTACGLGIAKTTEQLEQQCVKKAPETTPLSKTECEVKDSITLFTAENDISKQNTSLESCSYQSNIFEISEFTSEQHKGSPQVPPSQTSHTSTEQSSTGTRRKIGSTRKTGKKKPTKTMNTGKREIEEYTERDEHEITHQATASDIIPKPVNTVNETLHDGQLLITKQNETYKPRDKEKSEHADHFLKIADIKQPDSDLIDESSNAKIIDNVTEQHDNSEENIKKETVISEEALTDYASRADQERNIENRSSNQEHAPSLTLQARPETEMTSVNPLCSEKNKASTQDLTETPINREPEPKQFEYLHTDVQASQPTHVTEVQHRETEKRRKMGSTRKTHGRQITNGDNKETTINLKENTDKQVTDLSSIISNEVQPAKLPNALQSKAAEEQRVIADTVRDDKDSLLQGISFGWETAKTTKQLEAQIPNKSPEGSLLMEIEFKAKNNLQNVITAEADINAPNTSLEASNYEYDSSERFKIEDTLQVPPSVVSHSQPSSPEKRRKMGSTRKTGKKKPTENMQSDNRESDQDVEIISTDSKLHGTACGSVKTTEPAEPQFTDKSSEMSLLSEIELEIKKDSKNLHTAFPDISKQIPNSSQNTSLEAFSNRSNISNLSENKSEQYEDTLQLPPSQTTYADTEPSSPGRRRKMGSTRKTSKMKATDNMIENGENNQDIVQINTCKAYELRDEERETEAVSDTVILKITKNTQESVEHHSDVQGAPKDDQNLTAEEQHPPSGKRKFGSRRTATGSGLGSVTPDDNHTQKRKTKVQDPSSQLMSCDPYFASNSNPVQVGGRMENNQNEEENVLVKVADVSAASGLVSLDTYRKPLTPGGSTDRKKKIDFELLNEQIPDFIQAVYNVIMVGNSSVGKTSFIRRLQNGHFSPDYNATIGVDTFVQTVTLGNRTVKLYVWDTAGQERYHSITRQVFHKAQGFLLMYDITSYESFKAIRAWISQVQEKAPDDIIMMLLGNKCDCDAREVQLMDGENLSEEYNIDFLECSAASGENVSESMKTLAWSLVKQRVRKEEDQTVLQAKPPQKKSGCC